MPESSSTYQCLSSRQCLLSWSKLCCTPIHITSTVWESFLNWASGKCWSIKRKYGNGSMEVRRKAAYWCLVHHYLRLCLVGKEWLSQSDVRAKHWLIGLQRALTQSFSMTRWVSHSESMVTICKCLWSSFVAGWVIGEELWQHSHLHHCQDIPWS